MSKLAELRLAFEHYRNVESDHSRSVYIKENGRNNRSPYAELIEAIYDVLYCDTGAENAALRQQLSDETERLNEIIACYSRESVRLRKRLRISEAVLNQITCINPLQLSPLGYELLTAYLVLRDATEEPEKLP